MRDTGGEPSRARARRVPGVVGLTIALGFGGAVFGPMLGAAAAASLLVPSFTVSCAPSTVREAEPTQCNATVTGSTTPTGTVAFQGSAFGFPSVCTLQPIGGNQSRCQGRWVPGQVTGAPQTVTASYSGDANNAATGGGAIIDVTPAFSQTSVSCAPSTVNVGQATTCTVTAQAFEPAGSFTFGRNSSGTFSSNTCMPQGIGSSQISCSVTYTPGAIDTGTHKIYANFLGDMGSLPSHASTTITVT
jgi:hypothetical protein